MCVLARSSVLHVWGKDDGSVLSPVLKLLSGTLAGLGSGLDETAKELCKGMYLGNITINIKMRLNRSLPFPNAGISFKISCSYNELLSHTVALKIRKKIG
ncbi:hypothetical protein Avbf_17951 [Armadillidium vulgare]|nr:hypothetical protein Avbf_17951 [Armadillidium vulgare]